MKKVLLTFIILFSLSVISCTVTAQEQDHWLCLICGIDNTDQFCDRCGHEKDSWICPVCHTVNTGEVCTECEAQKSDILYTDETGNMFFSKTGNQTVTEKWSG